MPIEGRMANNRFGVPKKLKITYFLSFLVVNYGTRVQQLIKMRLIENNKK